MGLFVKKDFKIILNSVYLHRDLCMLMYFMIRNVTEASFAQCGSLYVLGVFSLSIIMMKSDVMSNLNLVKV